MNEGRELEAKGRLEDASAAYKRAAAKDSGLGEADEALRRLQQESKGD
jgi:hypothetical protein